MHLPLRSPSRHSPEALSMLAGLLLLLAWDASNADVLLARWVAGPGGFALREHWLLEGVLHQGAFAWVAGWFAFRDVRPSVARAWLAAALLGGIATGLAQQLRGAHFASHTLWTAWICWTWAWAWACSAALPARDNDAPAAG